MKKSKLLSAVLAVVLGVMPALNACGGKQGPATYKLAFYNGESLVSETRLKEGDAVTPPADPAGADGREFTGWYDNKETTGAPAIFAGMTMPAQDLTYYAGFYVEPQFRVRFETNGGNAVDDAYVKPGQPLTALPAPARPGYIFRGWYLDAGFETEYAGGKINADTTLYARWLDEKDTALFTLKVDGADYRTEAVPKGALVPPFSFDLPGYTLIAWTDESGQPFDFTEEITRGATLYAQYYSTGLTFGDTGYGFGVTGFTGNSPVVVVPAVFDGRPVTVIGDYALAAGGGVSDTTVTRIKLPDSITRIGEGAFSKLAALTSVKIPAAVEFIGDNAFGGCLSLVDVETGDNENFVNEKGFLLGDGRTTLLAYAGEGGEVTIPATVTTVGPDALAYNANITGLTVPVTVTTVGASAFSDSRITTLTYLAAEIPDNAFARCTALRSVTLGAKVTAVGASAFRECDSLDTVDTQAVTRATVGEYAFYNCGSLEEIDFDKLTLESPNAFSGTYVSGYALPDDLTEIADGYFTNWYGLTELTVTPSVQSIGDNAFAGCARLATVDFSQATGLTEIGKQAFARTAIVSLDLKNCDRLKTVSEKAFVGCSGLLTAYLPDGLDEIGIGAFSGCSSLTAIDLPYIGAYSKTGMRAYLDGELAANPGLTPDDFSEEARRVYDAAGKPDDAEYNEVITDAIYTPAMLFSYIFGREVYAGAVETHQYYGQEYSTYYIPGTLASVNVRGKVVPAYAFNNMREYDGEITFWTDAAAQNKTSRLQIIGDHAFHQMYAKTGYDLASCASLAKIKSFAFGFNQSVTAYELPASLTVVGESAFQYNDKLTEIKYDASGEKLSVGVKAFDNNKLLSAMYSENKKIGTVELKNMEIADYAFNKCAAIRAVIVDATASFAGVKQGQNIVQCAAFNDCTGLADVTLPENMSFTWNGKTEKDLANGFTGAGSIPAYFFTGCTGLKRINADEDGAYNIPAGIRAVGMYAFSNSGITSVTVPDGAEIYRYAFYASALETADLSGAVLVQEHALFGCKSLTEATLNDGLTELPRGLFRDCAKLTTVAVKKPNGTVEKTAGKAVVPSGVTELDGTYLFMNTAVSECDLNNASEIGMAMFADSQLKRIVVPETVTRVSDGAFRGCSKLSSVEFAGKSLTFMGNSIFSDCVSLVSVELPEGLIFVGGATFKGCYRLESVVIPSTVTTIGYMELFAQCDRLTSVTINASVPPNTDGTEHDYLFSSKGDDPNVMAKLRARQLKIYVPAADREAYAEFQSYGLSYFEVFGRGWNVYKEFLVPSVTGLYADETGTVKVVQKGADVYIDGVQAEQSGGAYTAGGKTYTFGDLCKTVTEGDRALRRVSGAYLPDDYRPNGSGNSGLTQFRPQIKITLDGIAHLYLPEACTADFTRYKVTQRVGTYVVEGGALTVTLTHRAEYAKNNTYFQETLTALGEPATFTITDGTSESITALSAPYSYTIR